MSLLRLLEGLNFAVDRIELKAGNGSGRPAFQPVHYPFKNWSTVEDVTRLENNDKSENAKKLLASNESDIQSMWGEYTYGMILNMYRDRIRRLETIEKVARKRKLGVKSGTGDSLKFVHERRKFIAQASSERNLSENEKIAVDYKYFQFQWYLHGIVISSDIQKCIDFAGGLSGGYHELFYILTILELCSPLYVKEVYPKFEDAMTRHNFTHPMVVDAAEGDPINSAKQLCEYYIVRDGDLALMQGKDEEAKLKKQTEKKRKAPP
jgi:hypothetical protein